MLGQQAALEGESGVAFPLVPACVVDRHGGPDGQFAGQDEVVVVEGERVAEAFEVQGTEDFAPRDERHHEVGVEPGAGQGGGGFGTPGDPPQISAVHVRDEDRVAGGDALGDQAVGAVVGDVPGGVGGTDGFGGAGRLHGERPEPGVPLQRGR